MARWCSAWKSALPRARRLAPGALASDFFPFQQAHEDHAHAGPVGGQEVEGGSGHLAAMVATGDEGAETTRRRR